MHLRKADNILLLCVIFTQIKQSLFIPLSGMRVPLLLDDFELALQRLHG